jgi:hypothetical protein
MKQLRKQLALVGVFLLSLTTAALATCDVIGANGSCPSLSPTSGDCPTCPFYYTYTAQTTYSSGDAWGVCLNPHPNSFTVPVDGHEPTSNCATSINGTCGYHTLTEPSATCNTIACDDLCSGE